MGIGVSYTGYDGATRHSVAQGAADLPRIMGETRQRLSQGAVKSANVGDSFKLGGMASDPVDGPLIGIEGNDSPRPDGQVRVVGSKGGWRLPVTRTEEEIEPSVIMGCNKVTLTKLQYDIIISEKGLVKGRSAEREVWHKSFFVLAEDSAKSVASGKFGIKAFFENETEEKPKLLKLAFGSDADLDTYNENTGRFDCNENVPGGQPMPVKVVETDECVCNPL